MYKSLIYCALFIFLNPIYGATCTDEQANINWCFEVSMQSGFYFFYNVEIEDFNIEPGSVVGANDGIWLCPNNDCDIIAAFYNDICVGWTYPYYNNGYTIPVMMNDGSENLSDYPSSGDIPEFRLYDNSANIIYTTNSIPVDIPPVNNFDFHVLEELTSAENLDSYKTDFPIFFNISEIFPNPFNASTTISYEIPTLSNINISVFNILGQEIITLIDTHQLPGFYNIVWNAGDIPTGFYIIRLDTNTESISKKVLLVK